MAASKAQLHTNSRSATSELSELYSKPLPASRSGALYSAFSYPTKISPESIAVYIASHTKPGDTILDTFGGSGTTGLAAHLCSNPTSEVIELAEKLKAPVVWGPRNAFIYELSVLGSFVAKTMCTPTSHVKFLQEAEELISRCEAQLSFVYSATDDQGKRGFIRHIIWSDILQCRKCNNQVSFWNAAVREDPISISSRFVCLVCGHSEDIDEVERVTEDYFDPLIKRHATRRKRVITKIFGQTGKRRWSRLATEADEQIYDKINAIPLPDVVPVREIPWGDLHRTGYHTGITHAHHFYTRRNLLVMAKIWSEIERAPEEMRDALRMLALSYNATHSTLMTRVVVKSGQKDFVLTGAQPGVLYISSLPVEKNIFEGLRRKAKTIANAFKTIEPSTSNVQIIHGSSTNLKLPDKSVDYIFTDPPFGDYIPYAELNFLNEVWIGEITDNKEEIIISNHQNKGVNDYKHLMTEVFKEMSRTLKDDGKATVVFHSAKAEVWKALQEAYRSSNLNVELSNVLDKLQGSFKQVTSSVTVKGDPLLLLAKNVREQNDGQLQLTDVIKDLIDVAAASTDAKELTPERLYSRFVNMYLENGVNVPIDAANFYKITKQMLEV